MAQAGGLEELEDEQYWENLCRLLADAEEYADAQAACEQAIELDPKEARLWTAHSGVLLGSEQYPEAIASADQALRFNDEQSLALTYQCIAYSELGQTETALDRCNDALRVNGDWGDRSPSLAWQYRGIILAQEHRYDEAIVAYDRTLLLDTNDSLTLLRRCEAFVHLGAYPDAITSCTQALAGNQQWGSANPGLAWYYQGRAYGALGQDDQPFLEDAIAAYDQAVRLYPDHALSWTFQGRILEQLDQPTAALTSYNRAVELEPTSSRAQVGKCTMLNQVEQYEDAQAACQAAIDGDGIWWDERLAARAWHQQSYALAGLGDYEAALASINRAIGMVPNQVYPEAWSDRAVIFWYQDALDDALESVEQALIIDPTYAQAWVNKGRILRSVGEAQARIINPESAPRTPTSFHPPITPEPPRIITPPSAIPDYEAALHAYEQALQLQPDDADIWANQSVVFWYLGQYEQALDSANQAIYLSRSQSLQALHNRGAALVALGHYEAACETYQQVVEQDRQNADAWANLGVLLVKLNRQEEGIVALQTSLGINPDQFLARTVLERLAEQANAAG